MGPEGFLLESSSYDPAGNVECATDGMGETTQFINDMWGRATEVVRADGETERYVYDHAGNVIAATDAEGNTVTYSFGERNQLVERTDAFGQTEYFCMTVPEIWQNMWTGTAAG